MVNKNCPFASSETPHPILPAELQVLFTVQNFCVDILKKSLSHFPFGIYLALHSLRDQVSFQATQGLFLEIELNRHLSQAFMIMLLLLSLLITSFHTPSTAPTRNAN